jgi:soluble lytic murein transglycosylase
MFAVDRDIDDPALKVEALRLGWPLAHDRFVWDHARQDDVDPYLVLAIMRKESVYSPIALSRVGARGAMQIMPRTGHLLAWLAHDTEYTSSDLEDPVLAVGYGITYMDLLMKRFGGAWPLVVASYNGGPHNVSAWLAGTGTDVPMDEFVEMIPFKETRDYVKRVSANYATYLALYEPGTRLEIPAKPVKDDSTVVDF